MITAPAIQRPIARKMTGMSSDSDLARAFDGDDAEAAGPISNDTPPKKIAANLQKNQTADARDETLQEMAIVLNGETLADVSDTLSGDTDEVAAFVSSDGLTEAIVKYSDDEQKLGFIIEISQTGLAAEREPLPFINGLPVQGPTLPAEPQTQTMTLTIDTGAALTETQTGAPATTAAPVKMTVEVNTTSQQQSPTPTATTAPDTPAPADDTTVATAVADTDTGTHIQVDVVIEATPDAPAQPATDTGTDTDTGETADTPSVEISVTDEADTPAAIETPETPTPPAEPELTVRDLQPFAAPPPLPAPPQAPPLPPKSTSILPLLANQALAVAKVAVSLTSPVTAAMALGTLSQTQLRSVVNAAHKEYEVVRRDENFYGPGEHRYIMSSYNGGLYSELITTIRASGDTDLVAQLEQMGGAEKVRIVIGYITRGLSFSIVNNAYASTISSMLENDDTHRNDPANDAPLRAMLELAPPDLAQEIQRAISDGRPMTNDMVSRLANHMIFG